MNSTKDIYQELEKLGLVNKDYISLQEIRNKDGVYLYRVKYNDEFYILKYFINDFFWTNLVVSKDKKEAIMFDYNLLGIGFRYNDIRNVCSSLSDEAGKAFIEEYGGINQNEKIVDDCMSILVDLIFAYRRPEFPNWAKDSLEAVHNGELEKSFRKILYM